MKRFNDLRNYASGALIAGGVAAVSMPAHAVLDYADVGDLVTQELAAATPVGLAIFGALFVISVGLGVIKKFRKG